jgi:acetyl esterase/lipase
MNLEGTEIAQWFNSIGMTAAILKYRVPNKQKGALQDAQRAMRMLRYNAHQWDFETDKIGIIGFSAGGHLAACTSTNHKKASYKNIDQIDNKSSRPNFAILVYPANLITRSGTLSRQCKTSKDTPRTILFQTQDDRVMVENSIYYYLALKRSHIPSELHIYPTGGHGYGLRSSSFGISEWPVICKKWLQKNGFLHIMHNR